MNKKTRIYMGIPSTGTRSDAQSYALRKIEKLYADEIELVYPETCVHRIFHDAARNAIVEEFLASDCDLLWFLDSDIVPPTSVLDLVTKHGSHWELAGCPYPVFMPPTAEKDPAIVMCVYSRDEKGMHCAKVPYSGLQMVDGLATGCMFIKREVFSQLSAPYFEFKYDPKTRLMTEGEDLGFCIKVNDLGYQFFTDFGMVCKHYKNVDLLDVNNYAVTYANQAVQSYDEQIRPKVQALADKYKAAVAASQAPAKSSSLILPEYLK